MAFAQLTHRESLRDFEVYLRAQSGKLYHMGLTAGISRNTLANANQKRDWRIYADFTQRLILTARRLSRDDNFVVQIDHTVYALGSSTIDLCMLANNLSRIRLLRSAKSSATRRFNHKHIVYVHFGFVG